MLSSRLRGLLLLEFLDLADVLLRVGLELALAVVTAEADRLAFVVHRLRAVDVLARQRTRLVDRVAREGDLIRRGLLLLELLHLADVLLRIGLELALAVVTAEADRLAFVVRRLRAVDVLARQRTRLV